ncbi:MAG: nuclear transport factor 2 family protein [Halieaceae bacterium]|jgi:hypothetical protein|nr:nuclear transport factor 2 family protein [Halieaceae bacterium]
MTLQERFNSFYTCLDIDALSALPTIYTRDVSFIDPVAVHQGMLALDGYFRKLLAGCDSCDFAIREQFFGDERAFVNWKMSFASPRLNGGRTVDVDGSSVLALRGDRIEMQRDYYDMGAMVYEQLPILGPIVRHIRGRMAA